MKLMRYIFVFLSLLLCNLAFSQESQDKLEAQKRALRSQIASIAKQKKNSRKKEKSLLDELESLDRKVNALNGLIRLTNREANHLNQKIKRNTSEVAKLNKELKDLKEDYAQMINKSYKSKSGQNRLMFLLSSESFLQAYKRVTYMQQYAKFRKQQGVVIQEKSERLKELNISLVEQQKKKKTLVAENRIVQEQLKKEQLSQKKLISQVQKDQVKYAREIKKQQSKERALDRKIEKLIREAIARSNKKAGASSNKKTFSLTAEAKVLGNSFTTNKGKLPWPVIKGTVIKKYGKQPHPVIPNIKVFNSGVEIETEENETARAIFDGEVTTIQAIRGAGKLVQIRHGNYITTYYNIEKISVNEGDKVTTKQSIGKVHENRSTGRSIMKFLIYQNSKFLNPQKWIYKMK